MTSRAPKVSFTSIKPEDDFVQIVAGEHYKVDDSSIEAVRVTVEWVSLPGIICDLDLNVYCYDDKGRFMEKLDFTHNVSNDDSAFLVADEGANDANTVSEEYVSITFNRVGKLVSAFMLFLNGDSRNFQLVQHLEVRMTVAPSGRFEESFQREIGRNPNLYKSSTKVRRDFKGVILCTVYKDKWEGGVCSWASKSVMEPVFVVTIKEKDEKCHECIVSHVPSLEKFKPRTFSSVRVICNALSSQALPKLKTKFTRGSGLAIDQFVEALFKQLKDSHPKILEPVEAAYTVAMLEEMFYQIDFNGDGDCSWEEFTNFAIQAVLQSNNSVSDRAGGSDSLNDYVIEYSEDIMLRDKILSPYRMITNFKWVQAVRRFALIQDESPYIMFFNEAFECTSTIYPNKLKEGPGSIFIPAPDASLEAGQHVKKYVIYDIIYLEGKDLYAFCSSDHTIGIFKEHISHGGHGSTFNIYNKLFHNQLHVKLCWSEKTETLCSVSSNRVIYGWALHSQQPLFNISRHSDMITDFISIDDFGSFATCSMDKRIVVWSATTRRVKAVFIGHKRGVRSIHYSRNLLLSCGFEADARIWDLNLKDCTVILRGHRRILVAGMLMCDKARDYEEYRAVTVDEGGELRLWNIHIREKTSEAYLAPALQCFEITQPEPPINQIRFLALPCHAKLSSGYYSDIVACSSKLVHFLPQKNQKEFIPPACMIYNDPASTIVTAVGPSVYKYDVAQGHFLHTFSLTKKDITSIVLDGDRGRKMYVGSGAGNILTINFNTGDIVGSVDGVHARDITRMLFHRHRKDIALFTSSLDGKIRMLEEISGELYIKNSVDSAFGESTGVLDIALAPSLRIVIGISTGKSWGIWNMAALKQLALFEEATEITGVVVIGASGDAGDTVFQEDLRNSRGRPVQPKESIITIAICTSNSIRIYCIDTIDISGHLCMVLALPAEAYINNVILFNSPPLDSVNFSLSREVTEITSKISLILSACTDDGRIIMWDVSDIRKLCESEFRKRFGLNAPIPEIFRPTPSSTRPNTGGIIEEELVYDNEGLQEASESDYEEKVKERLEQSFLTQLGVEQQELEYNGEYILTSGYESASRPFFERKPYIVWRAHTDSITRIICLGENGCIISTSHDGYQRCWNIDGECLGEMLLPNVTDKMLHPDLRTVPPTLWKFILERISVLPTHEAMAKKLIADIKDSSKRFLQKRQSMRQSFTRSEKDILGAITTDSVADEPEEEVVVISSDADREREKIFKDLKDPPKIRDDAPPTRIITKEEIRFMQKLKKLEEFKKSQQEKGITTKATDDGSKEDGSLTLPSISEASPVKGRKMANSVMNPSQLWSQPQDLFSNNFSTPNAFSGESMLSGFRSGLFDKEALSTLRKVASQPDKIAAYEHLHDSLLLRSYSMSTSVEIPKGNQFSHAEVLFGDQNGMYKNAAAVIKSREKPSSSSTALSVIAKARLEQSAAKIGPMTHVIKHGAQVLKEVSVPKDDKKEIGDFYSNKTEEQLMQIRLLQSKELAMSTGRLPRPLDMEQLADLTVKVDAALDLGSDYERLRLKSKNRKKGKSTISLASKNVLERKLMQAIKDIHRPVDQTAKTSDKKVTLTNKMLLPFYKVEDVRHYMDIFSAVDIDFSGDLDVHEWVKLFTSMDKSQSAHEARMIFMQLNKAGDGVLTSKDLIPIIFNKANKEQMTLIQLYVDSEIIQKRNDEHCLSHAEVAQLFECYDVDAIGFVPVETIRDRIRAMQLPEAAHFAFMDSIAKMEEDEMLNEQEFNRVLRLYTVR